MAVSAMLLLTRCASALRDAGLLAPRHLEVFPRSLLAPHHLDVFPKSVPMQSRVLRAAAQPSAGAADVQSRSLLLVPGGSGRDLPTCCPSRGLKFFFNFPAPGEVGSFARNIAGNNFACTEVFGVGVVANDASSDAGGSDAGRFWLWARQPKARCSTTSQTATTAKDSPWKG